MRDHGGMRPPVDDDDWVGVPPEGHHARDPAREEFWRSQWRRGSIGAGLLMALLLVVGLIALFAL
jgi:hypothetical protein